jgi:YrbI family 3-deoxy-D-manno-octulosonate 8-phosphate phosphatase
MKSIAFIPVRIGSKSILKKNIKLLAGKPLVYWVLKAAQDSKLIDTVVVASDSSEIDDIVKGFGFDKVLIFERSNENASDKASTEDVLIEYFSRSTYSQDDLLILIQATSPLLIAEDLDVALRRFKEMKYDSLLSCSRLKRFIWTDDGVPVNYDFRKRPRRQDFEGALIENGAFYISKVEEFKIQLNRLYGKIGVFEMSEDAFIELDEPDDWMILENKLRERQNVKKPKIKVVLSDVDGVLTDAGMYYSNSGEEPKKYNTHDGMAFQLLRESNIKTGIITSEDTQIVERRANKLMLDYLFQGKSHGSKLSCALEICKSENIDISEVAYIGDDINCKELLMAVGLAACPANALEEIKCIPHINVLMKKGGEGVFREFVSNYILV